MFESICIVGSGRMGQALYARLEHRASVRVTGRELDCADSELVVLCVPDRAIADVAASVPQGPWLAHTSGAMSLGALAPHARRFALHPLQTVQLELGPNQLDGAWCAVTADTNSGWAAVEAFAALLDLRSFSLADEDRPVYHAAATMAATFLVTLHGAASDLMEAASAPPAALEPLMRRTMDNGFAPTGPFVREDRQTVELHRRAVSERRPHLAPLHAALADVTERLSVR